MNSKIEKKRRKCLCDFNGIIFQYILKNVLSYHPRNKPDRDI